MKLKHFAAFLIAFVLVLGMTGCATEVSYEDDLEDEAPLSLYLCRKAGSDCLLTYTIEDYNRSKPADRRKVVITEFEVLDTMYARLVNEISIGGGPDLISINEQTDYHIDVKKIAQKDCLADLDILIQNSETFDFNLYNKAALDAGIIDGKRVMMPTGYIVPYLVGAEECFINNQLDVPKEMTWDTYLNLVDTYYQYTVDKPACWGLDLVYFLAECMEVGKPIEKTPELRRLFELLKMENRRMPNVHKIDHIGTQDDFFTSYTMFIENNYLFYRPLFTGCNQFRTLHEHYNFIESAYNSKMLLYHQPLKDSDSLKAYIESFLAVNINSKHKNEAFEFIQFTLSDRRQSSIFYKSDHAVNNESYQYEVKYFKAGYTLYKREIPNETYLPEDIVNAYLEHLESVASYEYIGDVKYIYRNVMHESIQSYYEDHITFDEMIDEINNKLAIYYSE